MVDTRAKAEHLAQRLGQLAESLQSMAEASAEGLQLVRVLDTLSAHELRVKQGLYFDAARTREETLTRLINQWKLWDHGAPLKVRMCDGEP